MRKKRICRRQTQPTGPHRTDPTQSPKYTDSQRQNHSWSKMPVQLVGASSTLLLSGCSWLTLVGWTSCASRFMGGGRKPGVLLLLGPSAAVALLLVSGADGASNGGGDGCVDCAAPILVGCSYMCYVAGRESGGVSICAYCVVLSVTGVSTRPRFQAAVHRPIHRSIYGFDDSIH